MKLFKWFWIRIFYGFGFGLGIKKCLKVSQALGTRQVCQDSVLTVPSVPSAYVDP